MRVQVAFTPAEAAGAPVGIVVDVLRATSTIAQALASGYERVYCTAEIEDARALRERLAEGLLGGERSAVPMAAIVLALTALSLFALITNQRGSHPCVES